MRMLVNPRLFQDKLYRDNLTGVGNRFPAVDGGS